MTIGNKSLIHSLYMHYIYVCFVLQYYNIMKMLNSIIGILIKLINKEIISLSTLILYFIYILVCLTSALGIRFSMTQKYEFISMYMINVVWGVPAHGY
jgi:hypothetical protein